MDFVTVRTSDGPSFTLGRETAIDIWKSAKTRNPSLAGKIEEQTDGLGSRISLLLEKDPNLATQCMSETGDLYGHQKIKKRK